MLRKVEKRGADEMARRLKQLVGQIFRFAIVTGRAKRDPSADLKDALRATGEPQRHRAMPLPELPTFLQKLETYSGEQQTKLALKLMTLTFLRTTELRAGKWNELENLDENSAQWRVPAERMKMRLEHLVPLSRQAVAVLRELRTYRAAAPIYSLRLAKVAACPATPCSMPFTGWDITAAPLRTASVLWLPRS
jgi:integrase